MKTISAKVSWMFSYLAWESVKPRALNVGGYDRTGEVREKELYYWVVIEEISDPTVLRD